MSTTKYFPLIFFICLPAFAQSNPMTPCADPKLANVETSACLAKVLSKVSRDMDATYKARLSSISPAACKKDETPEYICKPERIALERSQKAFLLYLKEQCRNLVPASYGVGNGAGIASLSCEIVLSSYRISELRDKEGYELVPTTGGMVEYPASPKNAPSK